MSTHHEDPLDFPVSWEEFHRHTKALAWRLSEKGNWKGIIAITRGGLVPAGIIARELDIKLVETFCISTYDHQDQREAKILKNFEDENGGENWLVIDDLVDTGNTAKIIREHLPKSHIATVYAKPAGLPMVDTFVTEVSQNTWIHFPWDIELTFSKPIADIKHAS